MLEGGIILSKKRAFLFMLPALVFVAVFLIFPAIWAIYIGLTNEALTGIYGLNHQFVWFDNFTKAFKDPWFRSSLQISFKFVFGSLVGQAGLGLLLALLLYNKKGIVKELVSNIVIIAWIVPGVVVAYLWVAFLDKDFGLLNSILEILGFARVNWFHTLPIGVIIIFNTWRGTAFSMLLFMAALQSIPPSYLETADVIGASGWQKLRDIILPLIRPQILTDLILLTLWTFNVFTPFILTKGGPAHMTEILPIYTYRVAFMGTGRIGQGAAISTIILLINLTLALIYLKMLKRK